MQTDKLFIYSQGDVFIKGKINPETLTNTCNTNEASQVFSFVQNQLQLPLSEQDILFNFQSQFNLNQSEVLTIEQLRVMVQENFTYTVIALKNFNVSSNSQIITSRFGSYAAQISIDGTIDTSGKGCVGGAGLGKGKSSSKVCTATGGAYGGSGGVASSIANIGKEVDGDICN